MASDDYTASLWDLATQSRLRVFKRRDVAEMAVTGASFSADATLAVTAHADGAVVLWDVRERKKVPSLTPPHPTPNSNSSSHLTLTQTLAQILTQTLILIQFLWA